MPGSDLTCLVLPVRTLNRHTNSVQNPQKGLIEVYISKYGEDEGRLVNTGLNVHFMSEKNTPSKRR
jgi:hypothetical protein